MHIITETVLIKNLRNAELRENFDCNGTYDETVLSQFLEITEPFLKRHKEKSGVNRIILVFIDKDSWDIDVNEWASFNEHCQAFEDIGFKVFGVCSFPQVVLRKILKKANLEDIKFPIIIEESGLSQSFGFYYALNKERFSLVRKAGTLHKMNHEKAKAVAVLDETNNLFWLQIRLDTKFNEAEELYSKLKIWTEKRQELEELEKQCDKEMCELRKKGNKFDQRSI